MKETDNKLFGKEAVQISMMLVLTGITQLLIIYKSAMVASAFGASSELDAYNFSNNIASFLMTFAAGGVTTVIIPSYINKKRKKTIYTFITFVYGIITALLFLLYLFRKPVVNILTTRDSYFQQQVCDLFLFVFLLQWLPALLGMTTAYFQCNNKYLVPKVTLLISNIIIVTALMILKNFTIYQYVACLLAGSCIQFILECVIAVNCGFRYRPAFCLNDEGFKKMMVIFIPTLFSSGVYKIHGLADSMIASNLGVGQLTNLSFANMIVALVDTMIIGNLTIYAYPKIVKKVKENIYEGQLSMWSYSTRFHLLICLLITGVLVVGREFISILLERGKFDSDAADVVYMCMCIYVVGQQFNIVRDLVYRFFYSNNNTKETFKNGVIVSILNIIISIILSKFLGIYGVVIGTTISGAVSLLMIIIRLHKNYSLVCGIKGILLELLKNLMICTISVSACLFIKSVFIISNVWVRLVFYGCLCIFIYALCMFVFRSKVLKYK